VQRPGRYGAAIEHSIVQHAMPLGAAVLRLVTGLILLIIASRLLVWGAVEIARGLGISDLLIGLTVVAVGTSLPELASAIAAARKGEHDIALGNVIGSNLFNTLAVVGIAGAIAPLTVEREVLTRDVLSMSVLTVSLFLVGYGFRRPGRINRFEGGLLVCAYVGYMAVLAIAALAG
jgi:cation:H+ antiporter